MIVRNAAARQVLDDWFSHRQGNLYIYEQDDMVVFCVSHGGCLFFGRVFKVGEDWVLSQDRAYYPVDGTRLPQLVPDKRSFQIRGMYEQQD